MRPHYNPNKKISQREIGAIQDAAKKLELLDYRENLRALSPPEVSDLRANLRQVQSTGDSQQGLRALRLIALLDWYEDAVAEGQRFEQAIEAAGELSDEALELGDGFAEELDRERDDAIAEIFADNPESTHEQLADLVGAFVTKAFEEAEKDIRAKVEKMQKAVELHLRALEALRHGKT